MIEIMSNQQTSNFKDNQMVVSQYSIQVCSVLLDFTISDGKLLSLNMKDISKQVILNGMLKIFQKFMSQKIFLFLIEE